MKHFFLLSWLCLATFFANAQILSSDPPFPTANDEITIFYNTTSGNGELAGFSPPLFAHTGVITNFSDGPSDWQHVQGNWGTSDANVVMTFVSPNLYKFTISPNVYDYYDLLPGEEPTRLMFVFRNTSGNTVGRNADGSDIFLDLYTAGFNAAILTPALQSTVVDTNELLTINAGSSENATLTLSVNGTQVISQTNATALNYNFQQATSGEYLIEFSAFNGSETITDSMLIIVAPTPVTQNAPMGTIDGINYIDNNTVRLQIFAPFKDYIFVVGDFNNWQLDLDYLMKRNTAGDTYWLDITGLNPTTEYRFQYHIDNEGMRVAEIYSDKILDPWNDLWIPEDNYPNLIDYPNGLTTQPVSTFQINQNEFEWTDQTYVRPPKERLVIYELLLRDFLAERDWQTLIDSLDYIQNLGITAIKVMPFNEFEGNESWGYNPSFFFAPDKYYGPKNALKAFVNECHNRGIAVIQDIALNHSFGQNPMVRMYFNPDAGPFGQPTAQSPWFNQIETHPFNVGFDFNHESQRTRAFSKRVLEYWLEEFHIDGYRFDLSKGFTQNNTLGNVGAWNAYDQSRVNILTDYYNHIQSTEPGAYVILEHLGDNSEETVLANIGMMLWGKLTVQYEQAAMGYTDNSDLTWGSYQARGWNNPHLITYAESHDEERVMFKTLGFGNSSGSYNTQNLSTALERMAAVHTMLIPIPGPKMIWQFGELGYEYSINWCEDGTINENCRTGNKPPRWDYLENADRLYLYKVTSALNKLKKTQAVFSTTDYDVDLAGLGKRLQLHTPAMKAVVVANFNVTPINMVPGFQQTGTWYDYFSHTSFQVNDLNASFFYQPGEYHLYTDVELEAPDLSVSVEEVMEFFGQSFVIYPNPAADNVTIGFDNDSAGIVQVELIDLMGRTVATVPVRNMAAGKQSIQFDLTAASIIDGTYIVKIVTPSRQYTEKVVISR
jgi:1,4-alpha-glucan branching enzyme